MKAKLISAQIAPIWNEHGLTYYGQSGRETIRVPAYNSPRQMLNFNTHNERGELRISLDGSHPELDELFNFIRDDNNADFEIELKISYKTKKTITL